MASDTRGRPKSSSRGALEDAATELFLESGYHATTVDDIAARAGVSRATFFNYFPAKSSVLWVKVDDALDALEQALGTGLRMGIAWKDMAVSNLPSGQPIMKVTGWAKERLDQMTPDGYTAIIHVSLTDDHPWAQAYVVIEAMPDAEAAKRPNVGPVSRRKIS
jgi:AcrR family transcriptional regulator